MPPIAPHAPIRTKSTSKGEPSAPRATNVPWTSLSTCTTRAVGPSRSSITRPTSASRSRSRPAVNPCEACSAPWSGGFVCDDEPRRSATTKHITWPRGGPSPIATPHIRKKVGTHRSLASRPPSLHRMRTPGSTVEGFRCTTPADMACSRTNGRPESVRGVRGSSPSITTPRHGPRLRCPPRTVDGTESRWSLKEGTWTSNNVHTPSTWDHLLCRSPPHPPSDHHLRRVATKPKSENREKPSPAGAASCHTRSTPRAHDFAFTTVSTWRVSETNTTNELGRRRLGKSRAWHGLAPAPAIGRAGKGLDQTAYHRLITEQKGGLKRFGAGRWGSTDLD